MKNKTLQKANINNRWEKHIFRLPENNGRVEGSTRYTLPPFKLNTQLAHVILAMRKIWWHLVCAVSFKLLICPKKNMYMVIQLLQFGNFEAFSKWNWTNWNRLKKEITFFVADEMSVNDFQIFNEKEISSPFTPPSFTNSTFMICTNQCRMSRNMTPG